MRIVLVFILFILVAFTTNAQIKITGRVTDKKNHPISTISITLKDTYDGAVTNDDGYFSFSTTEKGPHVVSVTSTNYEEQEQSIIIGDSSVVLKFILKEKVNELNAVTVTSGTYAGMGGKKGVTVLNTMDVLTTAGSNADISKALQVLPGVQQINNQEGLFVRGGDAYEAKQFVDGSYVANPYAGGLPNISGRSRFNPTLFKGFAFSTGGYSALYGQALSSALIMETVDMPEKSEQGLFISPLVWGANMQHLAKNQKTSWGFNYAYANLGIYYDLVKQTPDFFKVPQMHNADANFRIKTKNGIIKYYTIFGNNVSGLRNPNIDSMPLKTAYNLTNYNWFNSLSWRSYLKNGWKMNNSASFSINHDKILSQLQNSSNQPVYTNTFVLDSIYNFRINRQENLAQLKSVFEKKWGKINAVRFGAEDWLSHATVHINDTGSYSLIRLNDNLFAAFAESDIYFGNNFGTTLGARLEHSSIIEKWNVAPRVSFAYKVGRGQSISASYGIFYQKPENIYLGFDRNLGYTQATHYILNYQIQKQGLFMRVETYYKKYRDLVKTAPEYNNSGTGYARGIELYLRDKYKTFKSLDYSVSYTFLDTKRDYLNYPEQLTPNFAAKHTATLTMKKFFTKISSGFGATYSFATGRPYFNLLSNNNGTYRIADKGLTNGYQSLDLNAYKLKKIGKATVILFASATNVLGRNNISNYAYSHNGVKQPILPPAKRFYFIGLVLNWGVDRTQNTIDNL